MKLLSIATTAALALVCAHALAQTTTEPSQPADPDAILAVGGSAAPQTAMGAPAGKTRDQVYRELIQSQQNGEAQRMRDLFKGAQ
jgi:hypothetical protein